jgi:NAD(P) transhydrogenase beta subunit
MPLTIGVPAERLVGERRLAVVPNLVRKHLGFGARIVTQTGAGQPAHFRDADCCDVVFALSTSEVCARANVVVGIGANDVINAVARTDRFSPVYGMPILNADMAQNCILVKRGRGAGYSGVENAPFYKDDTRMLYGSAQPAVGEIIQHVKAMSV